ncbi:MAG: queuosine salvage family protein [Nitriliruptoraceae bacterium]
MNVAPHWSAPVLRSVAPVVESAQHVEVSTERIGSVASWLAYEELPFPRNLSTAPYDRDADPQRAIDLIMLVSCLNFAFTDFATGERFIVERDGESLVDTDGMSACIHEALGAGVPLLDGDYLRTVTRDELDRIFTGSITMPMLDERVQILNEVGQTLVDRYDGRFHRFVADCMPAMYADGDGLLERLVTEFPRFDDVSDHHGHTVRFYKLAQLALWSLHGARLVSIADLDRMTAFADYIVPVALRVMGILRYTPELARAVDQRQLIERDSDEEIEIRAATLYATALLTDEVNRRRPAGLQVVIPQLDFRLWKAYHATFLDHHLTRTIYY